MQKIYLVRHGQASFGQHNYDRLSALGQRQASLLGQVLRQRLGQIDTVIRGSMLRHHQTEELVMAAFDDKPQTCVDARWNEFDHQAVLAGIDPEFASPIAVKRHLQQQPDPEQAFRHTFHRAMTQWLEGEHESAYPESWSAFKARITQALAAVAEQAPPRGNVLIFTSGGVIARIAQQLMQMPETQFIAINASLVNCSTTKLLQGRSGLRLSTLNEHTTFEGEQAALLSYK